MLKSGVGGGGRWTAEGRASGVRGGGHRIASVFFIFLIILAAHHPEVREGGEYRRFKETHEAVTLNIGEVCPEGFQKNWRGRPGVLLRFVVLH